MNPAMPDHALMEGVRCDSPIPRWACAAGVLQAVALAVCLTLNFL